MAFSPSDVANLKLWLKSDTAIYSDAGSTGAVNGDTVQQWNDQSGNGHNATQATAGNRPTFQSNQLNGYPALTFSASSSTYLSNSCTDDIGTVFVVGRQSDTANNFYDYMGANNTTSQQIGAYYLQSNNATTARTAIRAISTDTTAGSLNANMSPITLGLTWDVYASRLRPGTDLRLYEADTLRATSTNATATMLGIQTPTIGCGYFLGNRVDFLNGQIVEIIQYNPNISDSDFSAVANYLLAKYMPGNLPTTSTNYILTGFLNTDDTKLRQFTSTDAINWNYVITSYTNQPTKVRDTNIFADQNGRASISGGNYYWMAHTNRDSSTNSSTFSLARSTDLRSWSWVQEIDCSAITGTSTPRSWAPKFYMDDSGLMHIVVTLSSNGTPGPFRPYELHPTTTNPADPWSTPVLLGSTGLPTNIIDASIVRDSTSTRYLLYKEADGGFIELATSTSDFTGYTAFRSGDWAGWGTAESGSAQLVGSTWFTYMETLSSGSPVAQKYSTGTSISGATWSALASPSTPSLVQGAQLLRSPLVATNAVSAGSNALAEITSAEITGVGQRTIWWRPN